MSSVCLITTGGSIAGGAYFAVPGLTLKPLQSQTFHSVAESRISLLIYFIIILPCIRVREYISQQNGGPSGVCGRRQLRGYLAYLHIIWSISALSLSGFIRLNFLGISYGIGVLDSIFYDLSLAQILLFITWKVALSSKVDKVHTRKYMLVIITSYYMVMVHNEKLDCQLIFYYNYSKALCVSHGIQDPLANVIMAMPFADIIHSIPPHQLHLIRTLRSGRHQV
eukprot:1053085_1